MRAAPAIAAAILASAITAGAVDGNPLGFWQTNHAKPAAPLDIRPEKQRRADDRARIHAATTAAAQRHGVPVEFMHRLTMRESGYRFVQGQPTPWGRAQGPHQILCGTARELGEHDCSRLMRDAERSADLAARYVRMGYDATGSWHGAAAHYHAGPNRRLWGPKTRAYAAAVAPIRVASNAAPFDTSRQFGAAAMVPASSFAVAGLR
jgi:hypothetical protein